MVTYSSKTVQCLLDFASDMAEVADSLGYEEDDYNYPDSLGSATVEFKAPEMAARPEIQEVLRLYGFTLVSEDKC